MTLSLYDTMSRAKRPFAPKDPSRVTMYVCGPTVYNFAHIGNFRPVVVFDLLFRVLRQLYGKAQVQYAANVTDVDDKINRKAAEEGVPISTITNRYLDAYNADAAALGALRPTFQPRVTETMDAIVKMIGDLIHQNSAYAAEGHVLFDTQAFADYGKLSGRPMDEMIAGARVDVAPYKRHPADFVLWKPSKENEPEWESPWGPGRPGWHIECTAMIEEALGLPIDIHGGGIDLVFPHHENELAQGVCAGHGHEYAGVWMHNGFLNFGDEKMSKSLGNVVLAHDLLEQVPGEAVRLAMLSVHYRSPLDWDGALLTEWNQTLGEWRKIARDAARYVRALPNAAELRDLCASMTKDILANIRVHPTIGHTDWRAALLDDLNSAVALQDVQRMFSHLRRIRNVLIHSPEMESFEPTELATTMGRIDAALSFLLGRDDFCLDRLSEDGLGPTIEAAVVDQLVKRRDQARAAKDWAEADRLRTQLKNLGVVVIDAPTGSTWRLSEEGEQA